MRLPLFSQQSGANGYFGGAESVVDKAWDFCGRLLALADKVSDTGLKLQAHHAAWATSFGRGELAKIYAHAQSGLALYDAELHRTMASSYGNHDAQQLRPPIYGVDVGARGRGRKCAHYGRRDSLVVAQRLGDPFSLAPALYFGWAAMQVLGDVTTAARYARESKQLAGGTLCAAKKGLEHGRDRLVCGRIWRFPLRHRVYNRGIAEAARDGIALFNVRH